MNCATRCSVWPSQDRKTRRGRSIGKGLQRLRREIDCKAISCGCDEQTRHTRTAKRAIRRDRRSWDVAERSAIRCDDVNAIGGRGPDPAAPINLKSIGIAVVGVTEEAPVGEATVGADVEGLDLMGSTRLRSRYLVEGERRSET
jgi:hypothetical protein